MSDPCGMQRPELRAEEGSERNGTVIRQGGRPSRGGEGAGDLRAPSALLCVSRRPRDGPGRICFCSILSHVLHTSSPPPPTAAPISGEIPYCEQFYSGEGAFLSVNEKGSTHLTPSTLSLRVSGS